MRGVELRPEFGSVKLPISSAAQEIQK